MIENSVGERPGERRGSDIACTLRRSCLSRLAALDGYLTEAFALVNALYVVVVPIVYTRSCGHVKATPVCSIEPLIPHRRALLLCSSGSHRVNLVCKSLPVSQGFSAGRDRRVLYSVYYYCTWLPPQ